MVKKIILLGLGLLPLLLKAQLVLNAQLPSAGFVQKDQLWNLILVNNNADILDLSIQMDLQDAATGQVVLSASTGNFLIGKGVKNIAAKDLQPIVYNYYVPELSRNSLPMGAYVACYQIVSKLSPLAQECIHFNIDPLSPPLLSSPADKAEIESPYPQFTWMPPSPYDMFTNLSYDIMVTEITEGQSATEAIQYNTPIYSKADIAQPYESYASSFTKLDTGKIYAWQVVAKNGLNYAAKTEVWTFKVKEHIQNLENKNETFIELNNSSERKLYSFSGKHLKISYYAFEKENTDTIRIFSSDNQLMQQTTRTMVYGNNFFALNITFGIKTNEIYTIEIAGKGKRKLRQNFQIQN
jgi:hypothetical protein